tara:strand:- start:2068 stop:3528 length:1461 start_codon:yes stop_codon:yes gene_type:complete
MANGLLDRFNNTMSGLPMSANLGLLTAGASLLDGGKIGNAVQAGLGTYQSLSDMEEKKKRRLAIQGLLADGNYTDQERALISASANPAAVALQIKNSKASQANFSTLNPNELKAMGFPEGSIVQKNSLTGQLDVVNKATVTNPTIKKAADGFNYYVDGPNAGKRVLPNVEKPGEEPKTERGADGFLYYTTGPDKGKKVFPDIEKPEKAENRRYQRAGTYQSTVDGKYLGEVTFDSKLGQYFVGRPGVTEGENAFRQIDMRELQPVTDGFFNIGIPTFSAFKKLRTDIKDDGVSLKRFASYIKNQGNTNTGLDRLADKLLTHVKTILTKEELSLPQLSLRLAEGEVQGLLGKARIETVGGGVMTEQDAKRVLENIGGDVNIFQNPAVVKAQIKRLFEDKLEAYNYNLEDYEVALKSAYRSKGYKNIEPLNIDTSIFDVEAPESSDLGSNEYSNMTRDEIEKLFLEADLTTLTPAQHKSLLKRWKEVK